KKPSPKPPPRPSQPTRAVIARPLVRHPPVPRPPPTPEPSLRVPEPEVKSLPVEIDPKRLEAGLQKLKGELSHWVNKGRYTKVRIKIFDKPLLPDLPIGVVAAAEGLSFMLLGPLQAVLGNLVGTAVLNVELISDAVHHVN